MSPNLNEIKIHNINCKINNCSGIYKTEITKYLGISII